MRSPDFLTAVGIGVSDLARSADFYSRVLGMKQTGTFKVAYMDEIMMAHEGRSAVVLMHYTDGSARNYRDNPVKLVFYVTDPVAGIERIRADGYVIELIQAPVRAEAVAG